MLSKFNKVLFLSLFYFLIAIDSIAQNYTSIRLDSSKNSIITVHPPNGGNEIERNNYTNAIYYIKNFKTKLKISTRKNVIIDLRRSQKYQWIFIILEKVDSLTILGNGETNISLNIPKIGANKSQRIVNAIKVSNCVINELNLPETKVNSVELNNSSINYLNFKDGAIYNRFIIHTSNVDSSNFYHTYLPEIMYLSKVDLARNGSLNFDNLIRLENTNDQPALELERTINLREIDLERITLPYDRFSFHVDSSQSDQHRIWIYQKLLRRLNNEGLTAQHQKYNTDYTELVDKINRREFTNWISKVWWNKGRNKGRVIYWGIGCFVFFLLFNFILVKSMPSVYYPNTFKVYFELKSRRYRQGCNGNIINWRFTSAFCLGWYYLWGVFWYTTFIFWGLRLNLDILKFKSLWLVSYIITQYTLGLIFVAYIVSFVIIRL
ncbi:hypothetical protein [Pedobacter gandavensis]|uniref:Uncharacterized protein n=1 Tax=Pedobacter gandavensis TaxID=2679963 RepID=A0ABR6EZL4_9SPHI|nr:hypothetical protein [Pedobacter gandavensis]MBB2150670.1 hypothetical protein [Pedobacter gandavensis]